MNVNLATGKTFTGSDCDKAIHARLSTRQITMIEKKKEVVVLKEMILYHAVNCGKIFHNAK